MNPEIKKLWLKALRSGKYLKGRARLCTETSEGLKFCCLGVLADVALDTYWVREEPGTASIERRPFWTVNDEEYYLTDDALSLIGLNDKQQKTLASINDRHGSFNKAIKYIEEKL